MNLRKRKRETIDIDSFSKKATTACDLPFSFTIINLQYILIVKESAVNKYFYISNF